MIKLLELFGGIGACSKAFDRLKIDYEIADYVEIDKYAVASYNAIHNTNYEPQDITKWDKDIEVDLMMHGSPCQDFSLAGKQAGGDEGSGTRSSLMYETIRIVNKLKPKYVIWENVKNLLSKKHRHNFDNYLEIMESLGYQNYYQVLNAKDYGIPQNRERVFTISIRQDIDNGTFSFPNKKELKLKLKDILEDKVDEKYYLSKKMIEYISLTGTKNFKKPDCRINLDIARPLTTAQNKRAGTTNYISKELPDNFDLKVLRKQGVFDKDGKTHQAGSVHDVCPAINATTTQSSFVVKVPLKRGYSVEVKPESFDTTEIDIIGNYSKSDYNATPIVGKNGIAPTVRENHGQVTAIVVKDFELKIKYKKLIDTIEKNNFTMGEVKHMNLYNRTLTDNCGTLTNHNHNNNCVYSDDDFEKASKVNSDTQLYKQAGKFTEISNMIKELRESHTPVNKDLCYLTGKEMEDYLYDMELCQKYASASRKAMAMNILSHYFGLKFWKADNMTLNFLDKKFNYFETIHNYINFEDNILRKGAVSARLGEKLLIPMNMRDGSLVCVGKGNDDWNQSAPHGAGRLMSRREAKGLIDLKDFEASMQGIYSTTVNQSTLDESPMAYKPMDSIVNNIKDTVKIINIIKPVYNF